MSRRAISVALSLILLLLSVQTSFAQEPTELQSSSPDLVASSILQSASWTLTTVDGNDTNDLGQFSSVVVDPNTGVAYASYYDATGKDLRVARWVGSGGNCGPNGSWNCKTVDSDGDVGQYSSLAIQPGIGGTEPTLHVAYYDLTNRSLKYSACISFGAPCTWSPPTIIDQGSTSIIPSWAGMDASIALDSTGKAHIAYRFNRFNLGGSSHSLKYASFVGTGNGTGCSASNAWDCLAVDPEAAAGKRFSLAMDSTDTPAIAYFGANGSTHSLKYAHPALAGNCGVMGPLFGNWQCDVIAPVVGEAQFASLIKDSRTGDKPRIAYYDQTFNGWVIYASYIGSGGGCGPGNSWRCDGIDQVGEAPIMGVSLAVNDTGQPVIAYYDFDDVATNGTLKVARPANLVGNCGPMGPLTHLWQCDVVDSGLRAGTHFPNFVWHDVGQYASITAASSGLATIAYYDSSGMDLRLARQLLFTYAPLSLKNAP